MALKIGIHQLLKTCPSAWHELLGKGTIQGGDLIVEESIAAPLLEHCPKIEPAKADLPPVTRQITNAGKAIGRALGAVLTRQVLRVPDDVLTQRQAICGDCSENLDGRCAQCGCRVIGKLLTKTLLAPEKCPLNPPKWDVYEPPKGSQKG
jgi:hypothetical protein